MVYPRVARADEKNVCSSAVGRNVLFQSKTAVQISAYVTKEAASLWGV
jgi:hypothetical protein